MSNQIYIGVDLGGTNIKVGICDEQGKLLQTLEGPTGAENWVLSLLLNVLRSMCVKLSKNLRMIGSKLRVLAQGWPDSWIFRKASSNSLRICNWHNVPAKKMLEALLGKKVKIDNDANVAALGEAWAGAGAGIPNVVCYTLGTGVGGGIIINGKIYQGSAGMAGELGHMSVVPDIEAIQCGCGQMGCLETVSSATGIVRMAKEAVERGEHTSLSPS